MVSSIRSQTDVINLSRLTRPTLWTISSSICTSSHATQYTSACLSWMIRCLKSQNVILSTIHSILAGCLTLVLSRPPQISIYIQAPLLPRILIPILSSSCNSIDRFGLFLCTAREYGLSRHVTITEAQKACPEIILQHVATWREGDEKWAYHDDAFKNIATHKVSLDPYRLQSRRILATIKDYLPATPVQRVEKASIDEVFLDLSAQIHAMLLEQYPELRGPAPYDDPTEKLPAPPTTALDWQTDGLVDLDADQQEEDAPDWDDLALNLGAEIIRKVRATVREQLHYTCSAGLARNKFLAKLGAGHKKPNQQTIIRNRAVQHFLNDMKFTKIRNLGGKLGEEVTSKFGTELVKDLLDISLEQFKKKLGDDTGMWLYHTIRGEDLSEVSSRTQIKSMLSAKSFRPSINTFDQGLKWLRIFAADIFSRLVEEGVLENKRRPKTINLHHRQSGQTRSKQAPIPGGRPIDEAGLFELAKSLLAQVIVDGRAWPCANLSLSVGGFEDGLTGNRGIGDFLVRGEEAKAIQFQPRLLEESTAPEAGRPEKRRRVEEPTINRFFAKQEHSWPDGDEDPVDFEEVPSAQADHSRTVFDPHRPLDIEVAAERNDIEPMAPLSSPLNSDQNESFALAEQNETQTVLEKYFCKRCNKSLDLDQRAEHEDWHFAKDMQDEEQAATTAAQQSQPTPRTVQNQKPGRGRGRPPGGGGSSKGGEKGQSNFDDWLFSKATFKKDLWEHRSGRMEILFVSSGIVLLVTSVRSLVADGQTTYTLLPNLGKVDEYDNTDGSKCCASQSLAESVPQANAPPRLASSPALFDNGAIATVNLIFQGNTPEARDELTTMVEPEDLLHALDRTKRVKDAKTEAQKEIEDYRKQKEDEFQKYEQEVRTPGNIRLTLLPHMQLTREDSNLAATSKPRRMPIKRPMSN
ncbi:hypothetical protein FH972_026568 [Carpinus fangiana]|uniref:DNA polymerase eta n=1 Tax=Carpinus fangiana TaxID=176857 RepID=A0A5N6L4R3_9ROSI|nr:hypothetical protein FH972_026568 [Carpinus fangiana]